MEPLDWNTRYDTPDYLFGTHPAVPLTKARDLLPEGGRALAVSDGEGRNSVWLAQQGFDVTAFDVAPNALAKAARLAGTAGVNVNFQQADIYAWDWDATPYDLVAGIFIQYANATLRPAQFDGMRRATASGGTLYVLGYHVTQAGRGTGGPSDVSHLYTEDLLRDAFAGMKIVRLRQWEQDLDEGPRHRGISSLIELVAQKPA